MGISPWKCGKLAYKMQWLFSQLELVRIGSSCFITGSPINQLEPSSQDTKNNQIAFQFKTQREEIVARQKQPCPGLHYGSLLEVLAAQKAVPTILASGRCCRLTHLEPPGSPRCDRGAGGCCRSPPPSSSSSTTMAVIDGAIAEHRRIFGTRGGLFHCSSW